MEFLVAHLVQDAYSNVNSDAFSDANSDWSSALIRVLGKPNPPLQNGGFFDESST
jgi:hypothetical protein